MGVLAGSGPAGAAGAEEWGHKCELALLRLPLHLPLPQSLCLPLTRLLVLPVLVLLVLLLSAISTH